MKNILFLLFVCLAAPCLAQQTLTQLLDDARRIHNSADGQIGDAKLSSYKSVRDILDQITLEFPDSDEAIDILLGEPVAGINVAALDEFIKNPSTGSQTGNAPEPAGANVGNAQLAAFPARIFKGKWSTDEGCTENKGWIEVTQIGDNTLQLFFGNSVELVRVEQFDGQAFSGTDKRGLRIKGDITGDIIFYQEEGRLEPHAYFRCVGAPVSTAASENLLSLSSTDRREIQRRLLLLDFDPKGVDGVFGPGSRGAIGEWQASAGFSVSGFLDEGQLEVLRKKSETKYQEWKKSSARIAPRTVNGFPVVQGPRGPRYRGSDGCLRDSPTNRRSAIIFGLSKRCNRRAWGLN